MPMLGSRAHMQPAKQRAQLAMPSWGLLLGMCSWHYPFFDGNSQSVTAGCQMAQSCQSPLLVLIDKGWLPIDLVLAPVGPV